MRSLAIFYMLCAQASFFIGMFICVLLKPQYVLGSNQGGVSNFATDKRTIVPFSLAFLLDALFTLLATNQLKEFLSTYTLLIGLLYGLVVLLIVTLVSSYGYKQNNLLHRLHFFCGIVLISYEVVFGILLVAYMHHYVFAYLALAVMLAGGVISILSLRNIILRLFFGQVLAAAGFAILLCGACIFI